jgi:hypothetical protein
MADRDDFIAALDAVPVVMLPVRIETRFPPGASELRVRIYPDQAHLDSHRRALSRSEIAAGRAYWQSTWVGNGEAAWLDLTRGIRPARAQWVVKANTPANVAQLGDPAGPHFGDPEQNEALAGAFARVVALPQEWLVVGWQGGTEVVRVWTRPVAAELAVGLLGERDGDPVEGDPPLGRTGAWAADYDRAVESGMAVTIAPSDFTSGRFDAGLDRLVVLGVVAADSRAPSSASAGAALLDDLLRAHSVSDGLCLLPPGTPTNDTGTISTPVRPPVPDPSAPGNRGAGTPLRRALGQPAGATLDEVALAGRAAPAVDVAAAAIVDATWAATLGYALDQLIAVSAKRGDVDAARTHARSHLRPQGPFPVLQIGRQPYGVLPVVAAGLLAGDATPRPVLDVLRRIRPTWDTAATTLRRLSPDQPTDGDVDSMLFELLRLGPVSTNYRFRHVFGPMLAANTAGLTGAMNLQSQVRRLVYADVLGVEGEPRLTDFVVHPRRYPLLSMPLVGAGADRLDHNYLQRIADDVGRPDARTTLSSAQPASLLEALVRLAAVHEIDNVVAVLAARLAPPSSPLKRIRAATPELPGITTASGPSPRRLAEFVPPGSTTSLQQMVSDLLAQAPPEAGQTDLVGQLRNLRNALLSLANQPVPVLEAAMCGFLDACSHRLDAWFTSLASAQLAALRTTRPDGVHVGAFGWVEGVRPESRPDPAGYLLGPSLAHASAAAVLRSAYETHRNEGREAFDVDLSSSRAEHALELVRAVGAGVRLGQVLGYQLERGLHDRGLQRLVQAMRAIAPLHSAPPRLASARTPPPPDPDTVDGEALLGRRNVVHQQLSAESADVVAQVDAELDLLADRLDAVADLAVAESVYQLVLGRPERVRAALALLDRQDPAPEPEITRTPLAGNGFVHRVVVALTDTSPAAGWAAIDRDARALAEPRLDAWLGRVLGAPSAWRFAGRVTGADGTVLAQPTCDLTDVHRCPLALVLATGSASAERPTQLEEWVARALTESAGPQPPGSAIELLSAPPTLTSPGRGLAGFLALAGDLRRVLERATPGDATTFAVPRAVADAGVDLTELRQRTEAALGAFMQAHEALAAVLTQPAASANDVRAALDAADAAGARGAVAALSTGFGEQPAGRGLLELATSVAGAMAAARQQLATLDASTSNDAASAGLAHQLRRLAVILGAATPVLPTFRLDDIGTADVRAALEAQPALTGGDSLAPMTWFTRISRVREAVQPLWRVLTGAEAVTGGFTPDHVVVVQRPHVADASWLGLPTGDGIADGAEVALVVVAPEGPAALAAGLSPGGVGIGALVVDSWSEFVPAAQQAAGLAFQHDAPGSRAPQAVLLAVPPDLASNTWNVEQLLATVVEAADLTAIRAVTLADVPAAGPVLPAIYLPFSPGPEVISVDLTAWVPKQPTVLGSD